jgi:hypothetical protein
MVKPPLDIDALSSFVLKPLTLGLLEENGSLVGVAPTVVQKGPNR